eukprot:TRINITY_DN40823_c0_g1_i1.p1 TRINITY_DN40823_c0_g1~~TRINITY_DN40823_c0_g1_i1.p1  ORF type:complete len:132 (+),score=8.81 TRINITY_DN40823_c0_g1_i1:149-544(+)
MHLKRYHGKGQKKEGRRDYHSAQNTESAFTDDAKEAKKRQQETTNNANYRDSCGGNQKRTEISRERKRTRTRARGHSSGAEHQETHSTEEERRKRQAKERTAFTARRTQGIIQRTLAKIRTAKTLRDGQKR